MDFDVKFTVKPQEQLQKEREEELKRKIKNSYPSRNGLKIPEIMVLYYARTFKTNQTEFQSFWYYQYAIENPQKVLKNLLNQGFICVASAEESLKNFKLPELKEMLKELGLKQSGKKADLIQRIIENVDKSYIDKKVTCRNYDLTDLGRQELSENEYVPYFHKQKSRYGVDVFWMNKQIHTYPGRNFHDLIWGELNRQSQEAMKELSAGNAHPYIWNRRQMCDFLLDENRNFEHALNLIAEADYYEVNVKLPNTYSIIPFGNDEKITSVYRVITERYKKIKEKLNLSDNELFQKLTGFFSRFHAENSILSDSDLAGLIVSEINEDTVATEIVYRQMETKLREISRKNSAYQYKNQAKRDLSATSRGVAEMRKDEKNISMLYIANWFIFVFIIVIALSMFQNSSTSGVIMLICAAFCSPFVSKKLIESGKFSKSLLFVSQASLFLIMWVWAVAVGTPKVKTVSEPPQQQIIAEEPTTEAKEQLTDPPTETESETIPETTETPTETATELETEEPTTEKVTEPETIPIELDSLQNLFVSLKSDTTREEIDQYIVNNGLVKYAFTGNEAYYIGYENRAVLQRERDRIGNAIDINFFTSGNMDLIGKVKSAKYKLHDSAYISKYTLMFHDGCFYLETSGEKKIYENGEEAMQEYLSHLILTNN